VYLARATGVCTKRRGDMYLHRAHPTVTL
jgi:hypothetical protein